MVQPAPEANSACYYLTHFIEWTTTLKWMACLFHSLRLPSIASLYCVRERVHVTRSVHCTYIAPRSVPLRPRENASPPVELLREKEAVNDSI